MPRLINIAANRTSIAAAGLSAGLLLMLCSGCVGPMACGPMGCDAGGPLVLNDCDGCSDCDGCGELYVDPWVNHPADVCDPCDRCGNYNGQSCGKCRSVFSGVASLWGYRCGDDCGGCDTCEVPCGRGALYADGGCGVEPACGCGVEVGCGCGMEAGCGIEVGCGIEDCGGCASCGGGTTYLTGDAMPLDDQVIMPSHGLPTSGSIHHVTRPSQDRRTRQIFRNRAVGVSQRPHPSEY